MELSKKLQLQIDAGFVTKSALAEFLGISRVTLDTRLREGNWKKSEIHMIKKGDYATIKV